MASEITAAIKQICEEKNLAMDAVISAIEAALSAAYRKDFGEKNQNIKVVFNADNAQTAVFDVKTVVEDVDLEDQEKIWEEIKQRKEAGEEIPDEESIPRFNPKTEIMLSEAKKINADYKVGNVIETKLAVPDSYGRMAAQTAKQVIIQRLREAERDHVFNEYKDKEGSLVIGTIQRREGRRYLVDLGQANAILPPEEQIPRENYNPGSRLNFYIVKVQMGNKGPEIILSRTHPDIVKELFAMEVPEIAAGSVEIKAIAREAGWRSKIAVFTNDENIDPIGSCVGQRGSRIQTIINELDGEKIDIIEWSEDIKEFIANALNPAKVNKIEINEDNKTAAVMVEDDQLSLAIGKNGQNVRLAGKLAGWKIDIVAKNTGNKVAKKDSAETDQLITDKEESSSTKSGDDPKLKDKGVKEKKTKAKKNKKEDKKKSKEEKKEKKSAKKSVEEKIPESKDKIKIKEASTKSRPELESREVESTSGGKKIINLKS